MTIRFRANSGTDMRRFLVLLLALLTVFVACDKDKNGDGNLKLTAFLQDADGYGITNTDTDLHYTALPLSFESAGSGEAVGEYYDKKADYRVTYHKIPGVCPESYLVDSEMGVWFADATLTAPVPSALTPKALLVCEEGAVSVEVLRLVPDTHAATIEATLTLWFEGEAVSRPEAAATLRRGVKLVSEELPGIYYCFTFAVWGDDAYFYDLFSGRAVAVPTDIAAYFISTQP